MSAPGKARSPAATDAAIWQQVEFGSYQADLPLWRELAESAGGPVLELGAGAGRIAVLLAAEGMNVIAVENDPELAAELEATRDEGLTSLSPVRADLGSPGDLRLPTRPQIAIGPLHVIQVLDRAARAPLLSRLGEVLSPGGTVALTVVDESTLLSSGAAASQILPDMQEINGWVFSSEPLWVQVGEDALTVRRLRERVSPDGRMERTIRDEILHRVSPEELEREGKEAGLRPAGRRQISSGPNEADSTAVLLEVPV